MSLRSLAQGSGADLRSLGNLIREFDPELPPRHRVDQVFSAPGVDAAALLEGLRSSGWSLAKLAEALTLLADVAADARRGPDVEFVLSGPAVPGIAVRDTAAVVQSLFAGASREVIVAGYAFHGGAEIFRSLAERWDAVPGLRVLMLVDVRRSQADTSMDSEVVRRFMADFRRRNWPWPRLPELYFDPRGLQSSSAQRAALHAKCVAVDRRMALVTSANFTPAAQERNIEVGVLLRNRAEVESLSDYLMGLCRTVLRQIPM